MEVAFEDLCSRFNLYLQRLASSGHRERGLVILDKSTYETTLQRMSVEFRTLGTQWGVIRHLADTPFFVDSRASRVIQLADHVAYAVFRRYHARDAQYFDLISSKFDAHDGVVHGLAHKAGARYAGLGRTPVDCRIARLRGRLSLDTKGSGEHASHLAKKRVGELCQQHCSRRDRASSR